jgi:hypothetical protein
VLIPYSTLSYLCVLPYIRGRTAIVSYNILQIVRLDPRTHPHTLIPHCQPTLTCHTPPARSTITLHPSRRIPPDKSHRSTAFVASCLVISLLAARSSGRDFPGKAARGVVGVVSGGQAKLV